MAGKRTDPTGKEYDGIVVLGLNGVNPHGKRLVSAKCRCGTIFTVILSKLRDRTTKSCGCLQKAKDYSGQEFGQVLVLKNLGADEYRSQRVSCRCLLCDHIFETAMKNLLCGRTKSCGCKRWEDVVGKRYGYAVVLAHAGIDRRFGQQRVRYRCERCGVVDTGLLANLKHNLSTACGCNHYTDPTGEKFEFATVVGVVGRNKLGREIVQADCHLCGKRFTTILHYLRTGNTKSCGCMKSYQEQRIAEWLTANGYRFERQFKIPECINRGLLPFDFAVFLGDELRVIEYYGSQHYKAMKPFNFAHIQNCDAIKQAYCDNFNIPLLILDKTYKEIPYTLEWFLEERSSTMA